MKVLYAMTTVHVVAIAVIVILPRRYLSTGRRKDPETEH